MQASFSQCRVVGAVRLQAPRARPNKVLLVKQARLRFAICAQPMVPIDEPFAVSLRKLLKGVGYYSSTAILYGALYGCLSPSALDRVWHGCLVLAVVQ